MSTSLPAYEIYAVKYAGPLVSSVAMVFWNTDWDKKVERNHYVWVVIGMTIYFTYWIKHSALRRREGTVISSAGMFKKFF